jgi:hypothetical protein
MIRLFEKRSLACMGSEGLRVCIVSASSALTLAGTSRRKIQPRIVVMHIVKMLQRG